MYEDVKTIKTSSFLCLLMSFCILVGSQLMEKRREIGIRAIIEQSESKLAIWRLTLRNRAIMDLKIKKGS